jgi:uncharacterized protein YmfQ (DUF2313 family)
MAITDEELDAYRSALEALLPTGLLWTRSPDSVRSMVLRGLGHEGAQVADRARQLLAESDPRTCDELLPEWEVYAGTDRLGIDLSTLTTSQRRELVVCWLTLERSSAVQFFVDLAAKFGYAITITEYRPAHVSPNAGDPDLWGDDFASKIGDALWTEEWQFVWQVNAPAVTVTYAGIGDRIGDALATWGNDFLEQLIRAAKPAHTAVLFSYAAP